MNIFQSGVFKLASGTASNWKIECDNLTPEDWDTLAIMAMEFLPPFGYVVGVPRGGLKFAEALSKYRVDAIPIRLVVDDVWTTGKSMGRFMTEKSIGCVAFARTPPPPEVYSVFMMNKGR